MNAKNPTKNSLVLLYGIAAYVIGMGVLTYSILFVGNWFVPWSIDQAHSYIGLNGYMINAAFLGLFAVQHTIMARQKFKDWITKYIPVAAERSTFVLVTSLILAGMMICWRTVYQRAVTAIERVQAIRDASPEFELKDSHGPNKAGIFNADATGTYWRSKTQQNWGEPCGKASYRPK